MKKDLLLRIVIMGLLSILAFLILFFLKISHEYNYENLFPDVLSKAFIAAVPYGLGLWVIVGGYQVYVFYNKTTGK